MPDGGPQSGDDGVVEAGQIPARRRPTPGRSRMPDGGQQSADDEVVEASEHPAGAGCRTAARRVQMMELSKPASSRRAAAPHPAGAGCRTSYTWFRHVCARLFQVGRIPDVWRLGNHSFFRFSLTQKDLCALAI